MLEHEALSDEADHPAARLPNKLRPLPKRIRPGSFILPIDIVRKLGNGHIGLGEA
jgi:hypothetical protein